MSNSTSSRFAVKHHSLAPIEEHTPPRKTAGCVQFWPLCCLILASMTFPLAMGTSAIAQDDSEMNEFDMDEDYDMGMDEDYDMGMDEDYDMMGSGSRSSSSGNFQQVLAEAQQNALLTMVANMDLSPLSAPAESLGLSIEAGPELRGDAEKAYQSGNYPAALQLHFAHMVTEFEQAHPQLRTVKYSKLLRRPVWQIRWGVSYSVRGEAESSDPSPIKEGQTPRLIGGGRGGFDDDMDMDMGMGMGMEEEMMDMESEMMDMEDEMMDMDMDMNGGGRGRRQASSISAPATVTRTMLSENAKSQMEKYLGLVAKVVEEKFSERYRQEAFGPALCNVNTAVAEVEDPNGRPARGDANSAVATSLKGPVDDLLAESPETPPMWIPGVMFLGATDAKSALQDAKLDRIDLLFHFDISLKTNQNQQTKNVSRCRVISVATGKPLASSKSLDSFEVAQLARSGRTGERAYVEERLANLFMVIDTKVKAADMPKLNAEIAKKRVGSLLSASPTDRLRALAEVRLYEVQGLLSAEDVETAFEIVGGQEGLAILHGPSSQKLSIAREWVLGALGNSN